jgi:LPXTG-motif cell wall-anchored protein
MKQHSLSIWFLIGLQLAIYGALILGAGLYQLFVPVSPPVVLGDLHPAIWWGLLMLALGFFYIFKFRRKPTAV